MGDAPFADVEGLLRALAPGFVRAIGELLG